MAEPLITDAQLAAIALEPLRAANDAGEIWQRPLTELIAIRQLTETRRRRPMGGATFARCIMPAAIGPCPE